MHFCFVDESGGFEAPNQHPTSTPLMVIAGLIIPSYTLAPLTADLLGLKQRFYPRKKQLYLNYLLEEFKGSSLRCATLVAKPWLGSFTKTTIQGSLSTWWTVPTFTRRDVTLRRRWRFRMWMRLGLACPVGRVGRRPW